MLAETNLLSGPVDPGSVWTNEYVDRDAPPIREYAGRIGRTESER
jgi:NitT/TauT family transport system substrate-binding protein